MYAVTGIWLRIRVAELEKKNAVATMVDLMVSWIGLKWSTRKIDCRGHRDCKTPIKVNRILSWRRFHGSPM